MFFIIIVSLINLTLVVVAHGHSHIVLLFNLVAKVTNLVRGSCKCRTLQGKEVKRVSNELGCGELTSSLSHETRIKRVGDTR